MSAIEIAATAVKAPGKVWVRNTTTAPAEVLELDINDWNNAWITVQAETDDVYIRFGTTIATATPVAASTVSVIGPPVVPSVDGSLHIPAGTTREFYLRDFIKTSSEKIYLGHVSLAASPGYIRFYKSSGPRDL